MALDFSVITDHLPVFIAGAWMTLKLAFVSVIFGMIIGGLCAVATLAGARPVRALVQVFLLLMRGIPFIVLIFLIHYGLPAFGIRVPALFSGILALSLFAGAYYAEVIRACVQALPKGQWESARTIGMSRTAAARHVIVPQILAPMIPPCVNVTITMIKESSVLSSITIMELTMQGLIVQGQTYAPFEVFIAVAALYWIITGIFSTIARAAERRLGQTSASRRMTPLVARYLVLEGKRAK